MNNACSQRNVSFLCHINGKFDEQLHEISFFVTSIEGDLELGGNKHILKNFHRK